MIEETQAQQSKDKLSELIPMMEGWLTVERAYEMYELVRSLEPKVMVEIGVFGGRSLVTQGLALKDLGHGHIYGIDPWKKETALSEVDLAQAAWWQTIDFHKIHSACIDKIWELELDEYITVIRSASHHCHQIIPSIDIIYIDGSHTETSSCRDVTLYLPKVKQNGYIWFDDCDWGTTQPALAMLDLKCKLVRDCGSYRLYCKY